MDENYFVAKRQNFQDQMKAKDDHAQEVRQLLMYVVNHCHSLLSQEALKLNPYLATLQLQFSHPNNTRYDERQVGETKLLCHGGQHSGTEYDDFLICSVPKQLSIRVMSGSAEVGTFKRGEVDGNTVSRLLIDHAFRCLQKKHKLDADDSVE